MKEKTLEIIFGISLILLIALIVVSLGSDILRLVGIF